MVYNPVTDFLGAWRNVAGVVSKMELPGLDYVLAALARAGVINLAVSAAAPVANQATTAWLKTAVPSYSAEGAFFLWDKVTTTYLPATSALFLQLLEASAGQNGVSWWTAAGGPPLNTVGLNGDFALRTDEPGGIFGPKVAGAWPVLPIPGTTDVISSTQLDSTFGTVEGTFIVRGLAVWQPFAIGGVNNVMVSTGLLPQWEALSTLMDVVFGASQGSVLYRDVALWAALGPGVANQVLASGGPAANPAWAPRTAEFPSGTVMLFQQSAAPAGWTKQVALNDYGLRVTSGTVGSTPGSAFSTVFAQTTVGNTTLSAAQIPSHTHGVPYVTSTGIQANSPPGGLIYNPGGTTTTDAGTGGNGAHAHSVNLTLAYVDVIIASKN